MANFSSEYQQACKTEAQRLRIAEKWAQINRSPSAKAFDRGRSDRLSGKPCFSVNGRYLDGWNSV